MNSKSQQNSILDMEHAIGYSGRVFNLNNKLKRLLGAYCCIRMAKNIYAYLVLLSSFQILVILISNPFCKDTMIKLHVIEKSQKILLTYFFKVWQFQIRDCKSHQANEETIQMSSYGITYKESLFSDSQSTIMKWFALNLVMMIDFYFHVETQWIKESLFGTAQMGIKLTPFI